MRFLFFFLVLIQIFKTVYSCSQQSECGQCHYCDTTVQKCIQVTPNTDPYGDCKIKCGVTMVCGTEPYCIYQTLPQCDCDWITGLCKNEEFDDLSLLKKRGSDISFSLPIPSILEKDSDFNAEDIILIKEILAHHKSKREIQESPSIGGDFIDTYGHSLHSLTTLFLFIMFIVIITFIIKINSELKQQRDLENQKEK